MSDNLDRLRTALADRYRIERELGQGGMATVYLAEDLKHKRKVALKVLKPELAAVLGAERFVQEITTTASLQHPHILPLFDSGTADGFLFYVMPYIQGETLRDKLNRETQLGVDEAVTIAREIADALHHAHVHGVVHRDIKPENILLADGRPMVADFGIALAVSAAAGGRMTETGLSLGTPHYMSPEQATAEKDLTARSDIYSLASVLYEMLSGNPPHVGATAQQIIMKIVTEDAAPVTQARKTVPPHVSDAIAIALEKLPADRFASAREFADALGASGTTTARTTQSKSRPATIAQVPSRQRSALAAALVLAIGFGVWSWSRPSVAPPLSRQRVVLWQHALQQFLAPGIERHATQAAIAPDGSSIVFVDSVGGNTQLLRKDRSESEPVAYPGSEGAMSPFYSPNGDWVGYITTDGKLRKVPVAGGGSVTLSEDANKIYNTAVWMDNDTIVFVNDLLRLTAIPAAGGAAREIGAATRAARQYIATLTPLPGSRGVLFTGCPGNCSIGSAVFVYEFATDSVRLLAQNAAGAWYTPSGHLLYTDRDGGLFAAGFDLRALKLTTGAVPITENVEPASFALSASGHAVYRSAGTDRGASELVWVARDGRRTPVDSSWRGRFEYPGISPDGSAIAVSVRDGATHLWIRRADGTRQRMTQDGTVNWRPTWAGDGRSLMYSSNAGTPGGRDDQAIFRLRVDQNVPPELVVKYKFGVWEAELARDGSWLVIRADEVGGVGALLGRKLSGDTSLVRLTRDSVIQYNQPALSPDGRWLAFTSTKSGKSEVYVAAFPAMNPVRLVSQGGGSEARWSRDSRELFYKSGGNLVVMSVSPGATFLPGLPKALFSLERYRSARNRPQYDVAPDGQHFVMIRDPEGNTGGATIYVENWLDELRAKVKQ